jgi:hypothetical protein
MYKSLAVTATSFHPPLKQYDTGNTSRTQSTGERRECSRESRSTFVNGNSTGNLRRQTGRLVGTMPRRSVRFNISAPVVFRWRGPGGSYETGDGLTRDIGIGGLFIVTSGPFPPENVSIRCEASLPSLDPNSAKWQLQVLGKVQRASVQSGCNELGGFAVRTRRFALLQTETPSRRVAVN